MKRLKNFSSDFQNKSVAVVRGAIFCYRAVLSPDRGVVGIMLRPLLPFGYASGCRYVPSCSAYADEAVRQYGLFRGAMVSLARVARCHPWSKGGYDPVAGMGNKEL